MAGRRTYDTSIADWGADGPGFGRRTPTIIVSHRTQDNVPEGGVTSLWAASNSKAATASALASGEDVDVFSASIGTRLLRVGGHSPNYLVAGLVQRPDCFVEPAHRDKDKVAIEA